MCKAGRSTEVAENTNRRAASMTGGGTLVWLSRPPLGRMLRRYIDYLAGVEARDDEGHPDESKSEKAVASLPVTAANQSRSPLQAKGDHRTI